MKEGPVSWERFGHTTGKTGRLVASPRRRSARRDPTRGRPLMRVRHVRWDPRRRGSGESTQGPGSPETNRADAA